MKKLLHVALIFALMFPPFAALIPPVSAGDPWCANLLNGNGRGVLESLQADGATATYDSGNDRFIGGITVGGETFRSSNALLRVQTEQEFTVTSVSMTYTLTQYNAGTPGPSDYIRDADGEAYIVVDHHNTSDTFTTSATGLNITTSTLWFRTTAYGTNLHMPVNYLTAIQICGTGDYQPPELGGNL